MEPLGLSPDSGGSRAPLWILFLLVRLITVTPEIPSGSGRASERRQHPYVSPLSWAGPVLCGGPESVCPGQARPLQPSTTRASPSGPHLQLQRLHPDGFRVGETMKLHC